jgi:transposase-like protein
MKNTKESMLINIIKLLDKTKWYETVRNLRWPNGTECPHCDSNNVIKNGHDEIGTECQHYYCNSCNRYFSDLTNTVFSGHHQPLTVWIICLYFMGLNLSNQQIAKELDLPQSQVQEMTTQLREGIVSKRPEIKLENEVEFDEVYVVAGHKGCPDEVKKKSVKGDETGLKEQGVEGH